ncbi:hypothetical protein L21SP2_1257 [Salinispira pacifica]|uniref:Uncharacterized protein n=1 Tax=Salinispira pacifica TaxID=1307761 RepID=V5WFU3_9SPIO|nr:hypothetical protein L21SP2_1257 [Salinispira pacifica]
MIVLSTFEVRNAVMHFLSGGGCREVEILPVKSTLFRDQKKAA